jgi:hypothetical protein
MLTDVIKGCLVMLVYFRILFSRVNFKREVKLLALF